ncbi:MAG: PAS domain S-box protein [Rubrobacter sp.]|nr:PAS domain S-box protein [Rubrobacter sp.]
MEHGFSASGLPDSSSREPCTFLLREDGKILRADDAAEKVFRRSGDELAGTSVKKLLDPESAASRSAWASLAEGKAFDGGLRLLRGDGTVSLSSVSISPRSGGGFDVRVEDHGGRDLEGRVSRWAERHYGETVLRSVDFHLVEGGDGRILRVDPEVEERLGWTPGEMRGEPLSGYIHSDDLAWAGPKLDEVRRKPVSTARMRHADGSWRHFEAVASNLTAVPTVNGIVWHFRDVSGKVRARDDLRRSGAQFRALVEGSQDMITLCSDANTILYASPSCKRILGYEPEEMIGLYVPSVIHPEDLQTAFEWAAKISTDPGVADAPPIRYRHKDGSWVYLESVFTNLMNDPEIRAVAIHSRDVTDRVEAERKLAESEARFRAIIETGHDIVVICDLDNTLRYISPSVEKVMGYAPSELVGRYVPDLIHPEDRGMAAAEVPKIESLSRHEPPVIRYRKKDGSYAWLECSTTNFTDDPTIGGVVVHARDVTERVRLEEESRAGEERYRALVEQVPAVNYTLVPAPEGSPGTMSNGSLSYISPRVEHLLGHPPEAFTSDLEFWNSLIHPEDLEMVLAEDVRTDETGEPFGMEYRMRHKDGHYLWIKDDAALVLDGKGKPLLWQCVLSDITRRREAEEEAKRLNEGLERMVEERTSQLMDALVEAEDSEELMRLSEKRFRSLVQSSSDITTVLDESGSVVYVSPAVEGILGYRVGELVEEKVPVHVHPEDEPLLVETICGVRARPGATAAAEFRFRHRDGSWRHLDAVFTNLSDEPGVSGVVINSRDVTERKEAERRYRTLVEQLPAVTYIQRAGDSTLEYLSPQFEAMMGYTVEEYLEDPSLRAASVHPDDREWVMAEDARTDETGEPYAVEHRRVAKDGRIFWVRDDAVLIRDAEGNALYWQGIMADITDRKEGEEELKESMRVLLALHETGQILASTLDLGARGERLLEVMSELFGLRAATIDLADPDGELRLWKTRGVDGEWRSLRKTAARAEARKTALDSGRPEPFRRAERDGFAPEGVCLPLKVGRRVIGVVEVFGEVGLGRRENLDVFVSLGNQSGSALENARLYTDLAEREKRLEELVGKLITAQEEERKRIAYEVHDGLAQISLVAHQRLRTFIEDHPPSSSGAKGDIERVMDLVRQTGREARRVISNLRPTVLDDFGLAAALRLHVETLRGDGMDVEYRESIGDARLAAHVETALYRVAQEALNNVRKHAPGASVRVSLHNGGEKVRLEVADDGPGFDPSLVQSGGPGERVGISSMRERAALVGGGFEVESQPGRGAKITVEVGSRIGVEDG